MVWPRAGTVGDSHGRVDVFAAGRSRVSDAGAGGNTSGPVGATVGRPALGGASFETGAGIGSTAGEFAGGVDRSEPAGLPTVPF